LVVGYFEISIVKIIRLEMIRELGINVLITQNAFDDRNLFPCSCQVRSSVLMGNPERSPTFVAT